MKLLAFSDLHRDLEQGTRLAVCGHIHESWGCEGEVGTTPLRNLGPTGTWIEI